MKVIWRKNQEEQELKGVDPMDALFFRKYMIYMDFMEDELVLMVDTGKRHNHQVVLHQMVVDRKENPRSAIKRLRSEISSL